MYFSKELQKYNAKTNIKSSIFKSNYGQDFMIFFFLQMLPWER